MRFFISRFILGAIVALFVAGPASAQTVTAYGRTRVLPQAATATLTGADVGSNVIITNTGASGTIVLTLPDCDTSAGGGANPPYVPGVNTIGYYVRVVLTAAQAVTLNPADATDQFLAYTHGADFGGATIDGAAGDAYSIANVVGSHITIACTADDVWVVLDAEGTVTDVN